MAAVEVVLPRLESKKRRTLTFESNRIPCPLSSACLFRSDAEIMSWYKVMQDVIELVGAINGDEKHAPPRLMTGTKKSQLSFYLCVDETSAGLGWRTCFFVGGGAPLRQWLTLLLCRTSLLLCYFLRFFVFFLVFSLQLWFEVLLCGGTRRSFFKPSFISFSCQHSCCRWEDRSRRLVHRSSWPHSAIHGETRAGILLSRGLLWFGRGATAVVCDRRLL